MEIERQRWEPLPAACTPSYSKFPFPARSGKFGNTDQYSPDINLTWAGWVDNVLGDLVFDFEAGAWLQVYCFGCYLAKSCTEYASYSQSWETAHGASGAQIDAQIKTAFGGKGARILDLDLYPPFEDSPAAVWTVLVPNYGPAARAWWWSGTNGATADELGKVLDGGAWAAGNFKKDGIKKKIVAIERGQDGKFRFVLNKLKPGEAWWWGFGASIDNITAVLNGEAWATFRADKIEKRLVSLKRYKKGNWTFLMVPRNGVGWWWYPDWLDSGHTLEDKAKSLNARVIDVEFHDPFSAHQDETRVSAILVQNT